MISGKVTREFVPPKCYRVEFGHHAHRQAFIGHSHRIRTPTRLQGTPKPSTRLSPNRPSQSPPIAHRRQRKPARSHDTLFLGVPHLLPIFTHCPSARLVRVVVRPTSCTAVKAHVLAWWGDGSRHRPAAQGGHISEPHRSTYLRVRLSGTPPYL